MSEQQEERCRNLAMLMFHALRLTPCTVKAVSLPSTCRSALKEFIERSTQDENIRGAARRIKGGECDPRLVTPQSGRLCWAVHTALPLKRLVVDQATLVEYTNTLVEIALHDPEAAVMSGIIERHAMRELNNLLVDWKPDVSVDPRMIRFCDPETTLESVSLYAEYPLAILFIANQSVGYYQLHRDESSGSPPSVH
jgi:hypothetical protein